MQLVSRRSGSSWRLRMIISEHDFVCEGSDVKYKSSERRRDIRVTDSAASKVMSAGHVGKVDDSTGSIAERGEERRSKRHRSAKKMAKRSQSVLTCSRSAKRRRVRPRFEGRQEGVNPAVPDAARVTQTFCILATFTDESRLRRAELSDKT